MQLALSPLFMLLASAKVVRWLAAALAAIALAIAMLIHPLAGRAFAELKKRAKEPRE